MLVADTVATPDGFAGSRARATLAAQGYLVIDRITDADDVQHIRRICQGLFETKAGFEEGRQFDMVGADDADGPKLPQLEHARIYAPELRETRFFANAHALARELLGPEVRFGFDHIIMKPAFDGASTPWHQDEAFRDPAFDYQEVSIWMPLQDVDERNGCMAFIPASNRGEVLPHRSPNDDIRVHAVECYAGFNPRDAVACPLPAGGCTVHTGRTLHGAGPNHSDAPRYAYVLVFDLPRRPRRGRRAFPWQADKKTARMERERAWRHSLGGIAVLARRKFAGWLSSARNWG
jgi:ectoine hydroxylase-related dioxygenase (phytanoyl-CoA dioxygenase family)